MKVIVQALRKLFQKVFHGNKPGMKVQPLKVVPNQKPAAAVKPQPTAVKKPEQSDNYWRDKVESDATEPKQKFYLKHRNRLENQDRSRGHDR